MNIIKILKETLNKKKREPVKKEVSPSRIKTGEPFITLFPMNPQNLEDIKDGMALKGFDWKFPLVIWKEKNVLVDGHTRLAAALQLGLKKVPVVFESFSSTEEAKKAAEDLQLKRRNLQDRDIFQFALNNDTRSNYKKYSRTEKFCTGVQNRSNVRDVLAKKLNISVKNIQRSFAIIDRTDAKDDIRKQIITGEITIKEAYTTVINQEKKQQEKEQKEVKEENCVKITEDNETLIFIIKDTDIEIRLLDFNAGMYYEPLIKKMLPTLKQRIRETAYECLKGVKLSPKNRRKKKVV